jgi:hypothetical protein
MSVLIYQWLHVGGVILFLAVAFSAFAAPTQGRKKKLLILSGILALVVIVAAFGLIARVHGNNFTGWMVAKIVIWLVIAALSAMVFRRPSLAGVFSLATAALALVAVYLVYSRPVLLGF